MASCAKCGNEANSYNYKGITFEICKSCNAIYISEDNFKKLAQMIDKKCEIINLFDLKPVKINETERVCNKCNHNMVKVFYEGIVIDRCDECKMLLFDNGELSKYFAKFSKKDIEVMSNALFLKTFCKEMTTDITNKTTDKHETKENNIKRGENKMNIQGKEIEMQAASVNGWLMVCIIILVAIFALLLFLSSMDNPILILFSFLLGAIEIFLLSGFKILAPQEAIVFTLFGKYYGTLRDAGFYWVNPFAVSITPFSKLSLKVRTLDNGRQKINDVMGNPIEVGIMVTWEVKDTAKAMFNVDNYQTFLSAQCDSALRNIVRLYPYDSPDDSGKQSLKGDSAEISEKLKVEIQERAVIAGLNIIDARITHLAYSSEIAMAMLQRQQASAVLDAKRAIVEGAVSIVEMALDKLSQNKNITLDEKVKANMVNNLLVVLCSTKESQSIIRNDVV